MSSPSIAVNARRYAPGLILVCGCMAGLLTFGPRSTLGLFQIPISKDFGWNREVFSFAIAIQNLLWGVGQPFAGGLADRYGSLRVLIVGGLLYAGGLIIMSVSSTPGS